jgi:Amidohydrolase
MGEIQCYVECCDGISLPRFCRLDSFCSIALPIAAIHRLSPASAKPFGGQTGIISTQATHGARSDFSTGCSRSSTSACTISGVSVRQSKQGENDWTAGQVAKYPDRLRAFCGVDPLKSYAVSEIERCAKNPYLHYGLKLHFGNSDVDMDNPSHVAQLRRVFRAADEHRMAIVVHMRSSVTRNRPYGAKEASTFLNPMYQFRLHILLALVDSTIRRLTAPFPSLLMPSPDMMFEWQTSISTSVESRESGDGRRKEP